jgi:hypothetical protein
MTEAQTTTVEREGHTGPMVPNQSRGNAPRPRRQRTPRQATRDALAGLPRPEFAVLDRFSRAGARFAHVDHVVVGPGGVFVIASAPGGLELTDDGLRHGDLDCSAGLAAIADAAAAVAELLPRLDAGMVTPVMCLARDEDVDGCFDNVLVCTTGNLHRLLAAWPALLEPGQVGLLGRRLAIQQQPVVAPVAMIPQPRRTRGLRGLLGRG